MPAESLGPPARPLPAWPVLLLFYGFPLWWILGLGSLVWPLMAVPMLAALAVRRRVVMPRCFVLWLLFLVWAAGCVVEIDDGSRVVGFLFRLSESAAAGVLFLYLYNVSPSVLPVRRVVNGVTAFWAFVVVGGFLGLLFPLGGFPTPTQLLLPHSIASNTFVHSLVHPQFAEFNPSSAAAVVRPSAPFAYTNNWGANYSLLMPFVIVAILLAERRRQRWLLCALLPVSMVPAFLTLNRGMFIGLGVGLLYVAGRLAARGHGKALLGVVGIVLVAGSLVYGVGIQHRLESRVSTSHTNATRSSLYRQALAGAEKSPLLGYGAPRPAEDPDTPSVGTQGQFWMVLYSYGFPGAALFVGWLWAAFWRSRAAPALPDLVLHAVLLMVSVEILYYGIQVSELQVVFAAAAIVLRGTRSMTPPVLPAPRRPQPLRPQQPLVAA